MTSTYLGKGLKEPCSPYRTANVFGAGLNTPNADGWNCLPNIVGSTTTFDLSSITKNHEVCVALFNITDRIYSQVNVVFTWYRKRDNKRLFQYEHIIESPKNYGYDYWSGAYNYSYIGWVDWEINENGGYYVTVNATGGVTYSKRIDFTITGIAKPKACINWIEPESSTTVRVGETVNCRIAMYNCGGAEGNFYVDVSGVCSKYNFRLHPTVESICTGSFVMPDKVVNLVFSGGHAESGAWVKDFTKTITLTPHAYCDQRFRVVDEGGVNVDVATVNVYEGGSFWGHCTTIVDHCMVSDLEKGHTYKAVASKTGYDCLNCEKTFTACTAEITLTLKKTEVICNQPFRVEDTEGNIITKNCYIVVREGTTWRGECPTGTDGLCAVSGLIKGKYLKACIEQVPSGYELIAESCQTFTGCTSTITLKLKKKIEYCSQNVKVVTSDGASVSAKIEWGDGASEYATTPSTFVHRYEKGKRYTVTASADGYKIVSKHIWTTCEPEFTLTLVKIVVEKKDTVICDFDILDAEGKKVTDLVAGVRYTVRSWLCAKGTLPLVGGCNSIPTVEGCASGYKVEGETLNLVLLGVGVPIATGKTNVDGYTSMYWTPSTDIAGDNSLRMEFKGSTNYNKYETAWKTVTVGGLRIKCDCTNIDVGDYVFLQEVKKVGDKWVHNILGGGEYKKVTADKVLYFTEHDPILGFGVGKHYSILAWKWWETYIVFKPLLNFIVPDFAVIELKEGLNEVAVRYQVSIIGTTVCGFFDIDPESTECGLFLAEFADPVFVANTLSVIIKHEDLEGNPREPETLDYVLLPIVMAFSFIPIPGGKIGHWIGSMVKLGKRPTAKGTASKLFLIKNQYKIHYLTTVGDDARLVKFRTFFIDDNLDEALKVLDEGTAFSDSTEVLKATKRLNLGKWIRGIRAKWKAKHPKTPIEKLMDDTAEHGGNVFKTQKNVWVKHINDAKAKFGDTPDYWKNVRKIWDDSIKTGDDVVQVDLKLAKAHPDGQVIHNIMRYTKDDYVKALKAEDAVVPEFASRFDEGVDFMLRHIGDETGTEVAKYRKAMESLSDADIDVIVKNLDVAGRGNLGRIIKTAKASPEKGMKYFDDVNAALKGTKKLTGKERKAMAAIYDTGIDDAMKNLDAKWKKVGETVLETDDPLKHPHFQRFWRHVKGSRKAKAAIATHGVPDFKGLPLWAKLGVVMGAFFAVHSVWKWLQDFCFALFMGEETLQWAGFGGIPLMNLADGFAQKPLARKKEIIAIFEEFYNKRAAIHAFVTGSPMPALYDKEGQAKEPVLGAGPLTGIFEELCILFGPYFKGFWEADRINLWALAHFIEDLKLGINPYTGIGECVIKVQADKDDARFWYQGSPTKWYGGKAYSWVYVKAVPVREKPYICSILAWVPGYKVAEQRIELFSEDAGAGIDPHKPAKALPLFKMIPDSELTDTGVTDLFPDEPPPDTTNLPPPYGDANPEDYFGEVLRGSIRCESIPTGAGVYLDIKDATHYKGKTDIRLEHIPVGSHKIIQTFPNFDDCVVNVNVVVEPTVYARCRFPTPTCSFRPSATKPNIGETVTFDASASTPGTGATILTYDWDWGDGKPHGTKKIDAHAYGAKGVYAVKLTVTNDLGGSKVCTTNITVAPPTCPTSTASFVYSPSNPKVGETVTFTSNSTTGTGATLVSWEWDFDDGGYGSGGTVTHIFNAKRIYHVKLTVKNDCCTNAVGKDSVTVPIVVEVPTGWIECYCTCAINAKPSYCASERGTKILVDGQEVGTTRESGYTKITLETGRHIVKYNLLGIMESSPEEIIVIEGTGAAYHSELKSILPTSQPAKVTEIIDGDSIRVDVVDREIRLIGYDAYEIGTAFGVYGKDKLAELIPIGSVITLKVDQYLPLDGYNRVIAGVFKNGNDMVVAMLQSCLVNVTPSKYHYKYYWIDWDNYELLWRDPLGTECILSPTFKPLITEIDTVLKTFKIDNRWRTLFFRATFEDEVGRKIGDTDSMQIEGGKLSDAIAYFADAHLIKLFACISKCEKAENWVQTDYKFAEVIKRTVKILCDVDAGIFVNGVKVYPSSVEYLEKLTGTLRKYRT